MYISCHAPGIMYNLRQAYLRDRLCSQQVFHLIEPLVCGSEHPGVPQIRLAGMKRCARRRCCKASFCFLFYELPDGRLTSFFQPHYSPVTPGQSVKSITVRAHRVCQDPGLVISSAQSLSAQTRVFNY